MCQINSYVYELRWTSQTSDNISESWCHVIPMYIDPCCWQERLGTVVPAHRAWQAPPLAPSLFTQEGAVATKEFCPRGCFFYLSLHTLPKMDFLNPIVIVFHLCLGNARNMFTVNWTNSEQGFSPRGLEVGTHALHSEGPASIPNSFQFTVVFLSQMNSVPTLTPYTLDWC
jgi:hypothetical protein